MNNFGTGLYTDMYELAMAEGYFNKGMAGDEAHFDYFFRRNPFTGGYAIFSGLGEFLENLQNFRFNEHELSYLAKYNFNDEFLKYLKDFEFKGSVLSCREGEIVFPDQPVLKVQGKLIETQIIETILLNQLNFQTLIATKASRIRLAAGNKVLSDFGLRRAPSLGGIHASKASVTGGFDSTSNVLAAYKYGIRAVGTMAHSFVQSFDNEQEAFRSFAQARPDNCVLLIDTYSTLKSGLPNAISIAKEMETRGQRLMGVRIDSGDLEQLSKEIRKTLDAEGLNYVKIVASSELDEFEVEKLIENNAPIDIFGIGTRLVTGAPDGALDGIYKLCQTNSQPTLKLSENISKITLPGSKRILRYLDDNRCFLADAIILDDEPGDGKIYDRLSGQPVLDLAGKQNEELLIKVMENGEIINKPGSVNEIKEFAAVRLSQLPAKYKKLEQPQTYPTGISRKLFNLKDKLTEKIKSKEVG